MTQAGSSTLTLNAANTFSGGTIISSGTVQLADALALQNSTATVNVNNGLIFALAGSYNLGGLAGGGNIALSNTAGAAITLQAGGNNASTQFSGNLTGSSGSLTKAGTGTLMLSGINTYGGVTNVTSGILEAITTAGLANYSSGTISVGSGAVLAVQVQAGSESNGWTDANITTALQGNANLTIAASGHGRDVVTSGLFGEGAAQGNGHARPASEGRKILNAQRRALDALGLEPDAKRADIKARFKMLVKRHHPDAVAATAVPKKQLREIIAAYNYLKSAGFC